jgi:hypothetical protein
VTLGDVERVSTDTEARPATKPVAESPKPTRLSLEPSIKRAIPYDRHQQLIDVLCSYALSGPRD